MICFCKKCRVARKQAKASAKQKAAVVDLPAYILSNYKRAAEERKAQAAAALLEAQTGYVPSRS